MTRYSDPWPVGDGSALEINFEVTMETSLIAVQIPAAVLQDDATRRGLPVPVSTEDHLDYVLRFQPEIVAAALQQHRENNTVRLK